MHYGRNLFVSELDTESSKVHLFVWCGGLQDFIWVHLKKRSDCPSNVKWDYLSSDAVLVSFHKVPGNLEALYLQLVLLLSVAMPGVAVTILRHAANHLVAPVALSPNLDLAIFSSFKKIPLSYESHLATPARLPVHVGGPGGGRGAVHGPGHVGQVIQLLVIIVTVLSLSGDVGAWREDLQARHLNWEGQSLSPSYLLPSCLEPLESREQHCQGNRGSRLWRQETWAEHWILLLERCTQCLIAGLSY